MYKKKREHIGTLVLPSGSAYLVSGRFSICCSLMTAGHNQTASYVYQKSFAQKCFTFREGNESVSVAGTQ